MRRTTIFLPDDLHEELREEAFRRRISMAELVRSRLDRGRAKRRKRRVQDDPLLRVAGICSGGRLSEGIDEAVYGI